MAVVVGDWRKEAPIGKSKKVTSMRLIISFDRQKNCSPDLGLLTVTVFEILLHKEKLRVSIILKVMTESILWLFKKDTLQPI